MLSMLSQPQNRHPLTIFHTPRPINRLERWVGVGQKLSEVGLEPGTSLGGGLKSIRKSAVGVEAGGGAVAGTITLSSGLDPDKGILESVASVGSGANTEASTNDVAPITPC